MDVSSDIVQVVNSSLPILELLNDIWLRVMDQRAKRLSATRKALLRGQQHTDWALRQLRQARQHVGGGYVVRSNRAVDESEEATVPAPPED